ncbi:MAG: hypothetical protein NDI60_05845 [Elusimicrobiales bacterium]|nr:hypothetical protein [Elusimicrobiales bacterium]
MTDRRLAKNTDWVEPELIEPGGGPARGGGFYAPPPQSPGLLTRLKVLAAAGLGLAALALLALGALLTSTVIGAIIGIPLMLAGAALFFTLFKLLSLGSRSSFIIRRF